MVAGGGDQGIGESSTDRMNILKTAEHYSRSEGAWRWNVEILSADKVAGQEIKQVLLLLVAARKAGDAHQSQHSKPFQRGVRSMCSGLAI